MRGLIIASTLALAAAAATAGGDPFKGWPQKQVDAHREEATEQLEGSVKEYLRGLQNLVRKCGACRGRGRARRGRCGACGGAGDVLSKDDFKRVYLRFDTRRVDPDFLLELEDRYARLARDLKKAKAEMIRDLGRRPDVTVHVRGTYATVSYEIQRVEGVAPVPITEEWVHDGSEWCRSGPLGALHDYPLPGTPPAPPLLPEEDRVGDTAVVLRVLGPRTIRVRHRDGSHGEILLAGVADPGEVEGLDDADAARAAAVEYLRRFETQTVYLRPADGLPPTEADTPALLVYLAGDEDRELETGALVNFAAVSAGALPAEARPWRFDEHFMQHEILARRHREGIWGLIEEDEEE